VRGVFEVERITERDAKLDAPTGEVIRPPPNTHARMALREAQPPRLRRTQGSKAQLVFSLMDDDAAAVLVCGVEKIAPLRRI
jgi:hypothetical protein